MFEVALLDLDNTLIQNPDRQFALAFMKCIDEHFQKSLRISGVSSAFRKGIQKISSQVNTKTITHVMIDTISTEVQIESSIIGDVYLEFYKTSFASLESNISSNPTAKPLLDYLLLQNKRIVIATNPLYPRTAIESRLHWGGLEEYIDKFILITNSDNMHVSKPNSAYYTEILQTINVHPSECIMVGDSIRNDIEPAQNQEIDTYLISTQSTLSTFFEHVQQKLTKRN